MASLITGNKFDPNTDIPNLTGKTYVVTGGSAGIGFGIVAHLLQHHAEKIYLLSNKESHADEAISELKNYGDVDKIEWVKCNLADLKETDRVGKELKEKISILDGLVCDAGIGVGPYWLTTDNIDAHFQINCLAQFHLSFLLLPRLQSTPNSRLVLQSSDLHRMAPSSVKFESLDELNQDIGPSYLYNRSKLGQVLFVRALKRRMEQGRLGFSGTEQVWANASHPGAVSTDQQEQAVEAYGAFGKVMVASTRPFMKDPVQQGCRPALFAATSEEIVKEKIQGAYIVPDKKPTEPSSAALDEALGENLWKLTEKLLTEKLHTLPYKLA